MKQLLSKSNKISILNWLKEWKIAVILITNSLLFFFLLFYDTNQSSDIGNRQIIGDVSFKFNTVKRKFEHNVVWEDLYLNSIVSLRDSILTESNSNAILRLKDGTEIHLDSDSMIILDISSTSKNINFTTGSINIIKSNQSKDEDDILTLETKDGKLHFNDADVVVSRIGDKNLNIGVARGTVNAVIGGQKYKLETNQNLEFNGENSNITNKNIEIINPVQSAHNKEEEIKDKFYNKMDAIAIKENASTEEQQPTIEKNVVKSTNNSTLNPKLLKESDAELPKGKYDALDDF